MQVTEDRPARALTRPRARVVGGILILSLAAWVLHRWIGLDGLQAAVEAGWAWLELAPAFVFFLTMALLCILPFPIVAFYVSAGPLYGIVPALAWIVPALVVNQLLAHRLANGLLRPFIERLIESRGYTVPRVTTKGDQTLFTVVVRITPGFPYFLQNVMLGIAGIERTRYLLISLPIQMLYATAFVVLGHSAFEGRTGIAIGALALILVASAIARLAHVRLRDRVPTVEEDEP